MVGKQSQNWCSVCLLLSLSVVVSAQRVVDIPAANSPMREIPVLKSGEGELQVTLRLGAARLQGPAVDVMTRSYGEVPGKTWMIRPGDRLSVLLKNDLEGSWGPDAVNDYHHPNTTNLHVHGLHVSPIAPSDDVLYTVAHPLGSAQYDYHILGDHSPGTYWYHPHHHGSTLIQSAGGAAGAIVVQDPPGYLSPQLEAMVDQVFVVQDLIASKLELAANVSHDHLFKAERWSSQDELLLVNGAPLPVVSARPGEWQRWRLVMAGLSRYLNLGFGSCEVALLAKDGVYIADFPRFVPRVSIPPGGRADLVVRCPAGPAGKVVEHSVTSFTRPADKGINTFVGKVFTVRVDGLQKEGASSRDLQPWAPPMRPEYLRDTRAQEAQCSCSTSMGIGKNSKWIEGHLFSGPKSYMHRSPTNALVERNLSGLDKHPYHQHSWHFQLQETPAGDDPYFKAGDWHDTYLNVQDSEARVRFKTADFYGPLVLHCHDVSHSDKGMIAVEYVGANSDCGCDLLSQSEFLSRTALQVVPVAPMGSDTLVAAAVVGLGAMLGLAVGGSAWLVRSWRDPEDMHYSAMAEGAGNSDSAQ